MKTATKLRDQLLIYLSSTSILTVEKWFSNILISRTSITQSVQNGPEPYFQRYVRVLLGPHFENHCNRITLIVDPYGDNLTITATK